MCVLLVCMYISSCVGYVWEASCDYDVVAAAHLRLPCICGTLHHVARCVLMCYILTRNPPSPKKQQQQKTKPALIKKKNKSKKNKRHW